jgi:uncharacterized membrane protein
MRNKWLVGGLALSLVLNLLLTGFVIGRLTWGAPGGPPDPTAGFGRLLRFLPEERRDALRPLVREEMRAVAREARGLRGEHAAMYAALTAEPFDAAALASALASLRLRLDATQEAAHRSFVALATRLTPEERRELAAAMRKPLWQRRERGGPPGAGPPD